MENKLDVITMICEYIVCDSLCLHYIHINAEKTEKPAVCLRLKLIISAGLHLILMGKKCFKRVIGSFVVLTCVLK